MRLGGDSEALPKYQTNPKAAEIIHKVESNPIAKKALENEAVKKAQAKAEERRWPQPAPAA